jgi:hypothetical protein
MAFLKDFVRPTSVVRSVMYSYGKHKELVFTNSYERCRTVKCYGYNAEMAEVIGHALRALGVKEFSVKSFHRSTIVRIPRTEQP